jgi:glyoxylase-like metal-dependent hydrolase (beta-lactamase superfamily II)
MKKSLLRTAFTALLALASAALLRADSSKTTARTVSKVADGIYVIRHPDAPDGFPQGNTTVVIGTDAVLAVDSCYLPSTAREDIAQIRQWTDKPVRYLVNTHWHYDHQLGNGEYAAAFPGLSIVAHTETRNQIRGMNPGWFDRYPGIGERYRKILADGKLPNGTPLDAETRAELEKSIANRGPVVTEFQAHPGRVPDVTFESSLMIDLGGREVQVLHLGRGNTAGDAVAFLPAERILVAGDLVDSPVPYIGSGYPLDQIKTLDRLIALNPALMIPGHGDVLRDEAGPAQARHIRDFITEVAQAVSAVVYELGNNPRDFEKAKAEVEKRVNFDAWRRKFAGDSKEDQSFFDGFPRPGVVQAIFSQTWPR